MAYFLPRFYKVELFNSLMHNIKISLNKFLQNFTRGQVLSTPKDTIEIDGFEELYNTSRHRVKQHFFPRMSLNTQNKKKILLFLSSMTKFFFF